MLGPLTIDLQFVRRAWNALRFGRVFSSPAPEANGILSQGAKDYFVCVLFKKTYLELQSEQLTRKIFDCVAVGVKLN